MQRSHQPIPQPSRQRRILIWLFSLLLVWLPYTELIKAATRLPVEMPCHHQMASGHQHQGTDCLHDLGDTGCHCCQLQVPPGLGTVPIPPLALNLRVSAIPAAKACTLSARPRIPLYRPPKQRAS